MMIELRTCQHRIKVNVNIRTLDGNKQAFGEVGWIPDASPMSKRIYSKQIRMFNVL
jgi:hypothetical protein